MMSLIAMYLERDELVYIGLGIITTIILPILLPPFLTAIAESPLGKRWDISLSVILAGVTILMAAHVTEFDAAFA